jgi:CRP/FNR family cyclic AMP-dependent transcriptional regulator
MQLIDLLPGAEARVVFQAGQTIFKEGDPGDFMYLLLEGKLEVQVGDRVIGTFTPVEIVGEMALIDSRPRSATVVAVTQCQLARIGQKRFLVLIKSKPEFAPHVMNVLVERIRWMNSMLGPNASQQPTVTGNLQAVNAQLKTVIEAQKKEIEELKGKLSDVLW